MTAPELGSPSRRALRWLLVGDGASIHTQRLYAALASIGVDVHLATFATSVPTDPRVHVLGDDSPRTAKFARALPELRRIVKRLEPDVVNAHYLSSYGLMAAIVGAPFLVQTAWGTDVLITARRVGRRALASFALRRAHLATADSRSALDALAQLAPKTPRRQFVFGPPAALFSNERQKEDIVLSPRAHEAHYRIEAILRAWPAARDRLAGHRLVVAGSGSLTETLKRIGGGDVTFVGQLRHDELLDLFARSRLVVSVPDTDATSASVLEAMAARCAVVATDLEANREWLPAECLVRVDPPPSELADAMVNCRDRAMALDRRWSLEEQVASLVEVVRRML